MEGYRSVSVKGATAGKLQQRAKEEGKSLSFLLNELLDQKDTVRAILKGEREIVKDELRLLLEGMKRW